MTEIELMAERMDAVLMAHLDQINLGTGCIEKWIDDDGNERSRHVPFYEIYAVGSEK